ncbi:unnamed protein product, partial [Meganyctiphanes norvegica]
HGRMDIKTRSPYRCWMVVLVAWITVAIHLCDAASVSQDDCLTHDSCVFPFRYKGQLYHKCTTDAASYHWCSTSTDTKHNHHTGYWQWCTEVYQECLPCFSHSSCTFPFRYRGKLHHNCTTAYSSQLWCSTVTDSNHDHYTGYWDYCDQFDKKCDSETIYPTSSSMVDYPESTSPAPNDVEYNPDAWQDNHLPSPPCKLVDNLVDLQLPKESSYAYSTTHTLIKRCRGFNKKKACVATKRNMTHWKIVKQQVSDNNYENMKISFDIHDGCEYIRPKCSNHQARRRCQSSSLTHYWDEEVCECQCFVKVNDIDSCKQVKVYNAAGSWYYIAVA